MGDPVICCLLGICCPPAEQREAWHGVFMARGLDKTNALIATDVVLSTLGPVFKAIAALVQLVRG